jgi:hypothetical protein
LNWSGLPARTKSLTLVIAESDNPASARGSTIVTSKLLFYEWTGVFGSERLTGALLDRLTHHVHILEMNDDSFRLKHSRGQIADNAPPQEPG